MTFALLPSLRPRERHAVIRVRVCRKWEYRSGGTDDGAMVHIDLVLVDEKGNSIYAEIPKAEIQRKGPLVEEGGVYIISCFLVSNAKDTFMPVPGNTMIEFTYHTMVNPVTDDTLAIPELVYHLTPFSDLEQRAGVYSRFTDVIGILAEVSDAKVLHLTGKPNPTTTRDIVLRDLSYFEIRVSLWGHSASSFTIDTVYDANESKPVVVLLVGTIVKSYKGQPYLSAGAACRWFFNPPIPEADMFYDSLNNQRIEIRHSAAAIDQPRGPALAQAETTTLAQLDAMDTYTVGDACYRCTVVIDRLVPGDRWWFPSCARCNRSCLQEASGYKCKICQSTVSRFKYKLSFVATDGTAEAKMVCFDSVAARIIGKPIQQLMRAGRPVQDFPPEITAVVSLRFTFAVTLSDQSFKNPEKSYRVLSMLTAHGRQASVPRSIITAGTSRVQTQPIDTHQQQLHLEDEISEGSAETDIARDSVGQQPPVTLSQTTFKTLEIQPDPSQDRPDASNVQTTPSDNNRNARSEKKSSHKPSMAKNKRSTARRELFLSTDETPKENITSTLGPKKQRSQRTSAVVHIKETPSQSQKSSTPDNDAVADATSDTALP